MFKRHRIVALFAAVQVALNSPPALAVTVPSGWLAVRVADGAGPGHCIDRSKESVSVDVVRVVMDKQAPWFAPDKKSDLLFNIVLSGRTKLGRHVATFPRAYSSMLKDAPQGMFTIGDGESLINEYRLNDMDKIWSMRIDIFVSNESGNAAVGDIALGIVDFTKKMSLPENALSTLDVAGKLDTGILGKITQDSALLDSIVKWGSLQLDFSSTGTADSSNTNACAGPFENTGTKAVIKGVKGAEADGIVDIGKFYCYRVVTEPSYKVQFSTPKPDGTCAEPASGWADVNNPLVAFYVNGDPSPVEHGALAVRSRYFLPGKESLLRCHANGISKAHCGRPH